MAKPKPTGAPAAWTKGRDPGDRTGSASKKEDNAAHPTESYDDSEDFSESGVNVERFALEQIRAFIAERFVGHELSRLVAEVLRAEGFFAEESQTASDGDIDVFAGRGPLGLDRPHLVVQVKSDPPPVDVKIVRELHGILSAHGAEQALLVAWSGITDAALHELRNQFFQVRVWDAEKLLETLLDNYDKLSEDLRIDLPLKRIWSLTDE